LTTLAHLRGRSAALTIDNIAMTDVGALLEAIRAGGFTIEINLYRDPAACPDCRGTGWVDRNTVCHCDARPM
jgi:hypothetical protein